MTLIGLGNKLKLANFFPSSIQTRTRIMASACCPPGSWGELKADPDYKFKGTVDRLAGDLDVYRIGSSEKCIIWSYDVYGFNGGRTRQLCDQLAEKGFMVIMPDYYRGKMQDPADGMPQLVEFIKRETNTEVLLKEWKETLKPYAEKNGAKIFGAIGTCWGTYPLMRFCALAEFKAGVSLHPSHPIIMSDIMLNEDEKAALEAIKANKAPQMFMPAKEDLDSVKKGGLSQQVLGDELCEVIEFNDMAHGWTTRGDLKAPNVERDVKQAMEEACNFLLKHVK